jgi:SAM-dependent methyltransferase
MASNLREFVQPHQQGWPILLHVGCGPAEPERLDPMFREGWVEVRFDIDPTVRPDIIGTITEMPAVANRSADAVWSSHNLEHLCAHEVPLALREFYRVLKPGGFLLAAMPDLQPVGEMIASGALDEVAYVSPGGPITPRDMLYGYAPYIAGGNLFMTHKTGFTARTLCLELERAGFTGGETWSAGFNLWGLARKAAA